MQIFNYNFSAKIEFLCSTPAGEIQNLCAEDLMFGTSEPSAYLALFALLPNLVSFWWASTAQQKQQVGKSNHSQGLLPECLELVPVFLAEFLSSLLCIHRVWLAGCSSLCHLAEKRGNAFGVTKLTLPPVIGVKFSLSNNPSICLPVLCLQPGCSLPHSTSQPPFIPNSK